MSARQVVCSSKGFKGRVLAFQSESSAFFYLCCLPRASGPPDGGQEKKNPKLGGLCTSAPPAAAKFWTSPRPKRKILSWELCAPVFPQQQQQNFHKSKIWTNNNNKRQSSCNKARALPFLFGQQQPVTFDFFKSPKIGKNHQ